MTDKEQIIRSFLTFLESKGMSIGGEVDYGFALERTEYVPLHKADLNNVITDYLKETQHEQLI